MKIVKYIVTLLTLFVSACSQPAVTGETILPNKLNLPILEGSLKSVDCKVADLFAEKDANIECILFPITNKMRKGGDDKVQRKTGEAYAKSMVDSGWTPTSATGNIYTFEKPINENCSHSIIVMQWLYADLGVAKTAFKTGKLDGIDYTSLVFVDFVEPLCGNERSAK